jgi:hypothetical protein
MDKIDKYRVVYLPEETDGVYAVSVVDDPANGMEGVLPDNKMFITLSNEQKIQNIILSTEGEKRLMTGVILIPEQEIYRIDENGNPFNLVFGEEEIRLFSQDFMKNGYQKNSTYNHDRNMWLSGFTFVESWLIEDPNNDKSNALGFKKLPKGTWMMSAYVEDDNLWDKIKSGDIKGFSIDSYIAFEKIELRKTDMASVIPNSPDSISENDNEILRTRYRYSPQTTSSNSREFCVKMVGANNLYRKEDIMNADSNVVNPGFGHNGQSYDLFKYKGGVYCNHMFMREIYLNRNNKQLSYYEALNYIKKLSKSDYDKVKMDSNPSEVGQVANESNNYWKYGNMSKVCSCELSNDDIPTEVVDNLISKGISDMGDEWVLIHSTPVDDVILGQEINGEEIIQNINKQKKMNMSVLQKLIKLFSEESVSLATIEIPELGTLTADAFEIDNVVYQDVQGVMTPLASTTFEADGFTYTTDETGKIVDKVEDIAQEEDMVDVPAPTGDTKTNDTTSTGDTINCGTNLSTQNEELETLKSQVTELQKQIEIITKEKENVLIENQELKRQPKETRLKANSDRKPLGMETTMEVLSRIAKNNK